MALESGDSGHLFPICQGGKYGFIDARGRIRVQPQFEGAMTFTEGLAGFVADGKWGYIDSVGKVAIEPAFDSCRAFSDGLAIITVKDKSGFIDRTGRVRIEPRYYRCDSFEDGLARVQESMTSREVFIDQTGAVVFGPARVLSLPQL